MDVLSLWTRFAITGFEKTDRKDFFDLTIGNVPFGNYTVSDRRFDRYGFLIHDYFFAKALDQVRPGGTGTRQRGPLTAICGCDTKSLE